MKVIINGLGKAVDALVLLPEANIPTCLAIYKDDGDTEVAAISIIEVLSEAASDHRLGTSGQLMKYAAELRYCVELADASARMRMFYETQDAKEAEEKAKE